MFVARSGLVCARASRHRLLRIEPLEGRALLATITVTDTGDTIAERKRLSSSGVRYLAQ